MYTIEREKKNIRLALVIIDAFDCHEMVNVSRISNEIQLFENETNWSWSAHATLNCKMVI